MRENERLIAFFERKKADRLPCLEWATWWDLTLNRWHDEGLSDALDGMEIKKYFGLDSDMQLWISPLGKDMPKQKEQGYIKDADDYARLLPYLYDKEGFLRRWKEPLERARQESQQNGHIVWFTLEGFFWTPRTLFGIEDHLYSFYDHPALYHRICADMTEYYQFVIEEITKYIQPQFMTFAEDMSYNLGPMLSEEMFDTFIAPYYQKLIPILRQKQIRVIIDSDGDVTQMIPWLIRAGADGILPLERKAGVDVNTLTAQYPDFFFIGGFDKMVMKFGEAAMREEFERILPAIRRGNYLPSVDHQTPPDVPMTLYKTYTELLRAYCQKAAQD